MMITVYIRKTVVRANSQPALSSFYEAMELGDRWGTC